MPPGAKLFGAGPHIYFCVAFRVGLNYIECMENHIKYPDHFAKITTDLAVLRKPSVPIPVMNYKAAVDGVPLMFMPEDLKRCAAVAQELRQVLYINPELSDMPLDGNILGYGLSARQLKSYEDKEAPAISILALPSIYAQNQTGAFRQLVPDRELVLINPELTSTTKIWKYRGEGCLSVPGVYRNTWRYYLTTIRFFDLQGTEQVLHLEGRDAVVAQHEVDHHKGRVFLDLADMPLDAKAKPGQNDPCFCGSGKKYKKCCA